MTVQAILLPLLVEVLITFVLLFWMGGLRVTALRRNEVQASDIALREPNWPARATQVGNAYHNQLELPVLFYVLTVLAILTREADLLFVLLAWLFVLTRLGHAAIHVTGNDVTRRGPAFMIGAVVLALMWAIFAVRLLLAL